MPGTSEVPDTSGRLGEAGDYAVSLQVRDTAGLTSTQAFTVTVSGIAWSHVYLPFVLRNRP